jgi:thiamine pyridinylase
MRSRGRDMTVRARRPGLRSALAATVLAAALFALVAAAAVPAATEPGAGRAPVHVPGAGSAPAHAHSAGRPPAHAPAAGSPALTVALFPWVPRPEQVEQAVTSAWDDRHPGMPLRFVDWDCYSSDPPAGVDVFVFDAILLDDLVRRGLVQPLADGEVDDPADLLPYALRAARGRDNGLYGVPMYGCASLLFYRDGDAALERADDLGDVVRALGPARYTTVVPPRGKGLLVDLSDPSMDAFLYVEALEDTYGVYTADPPLAPTATKLDPRAIDGLRDLRIMAGARQAGAVTTQQFTRSEWFGEGRGRALIGFSESLCDMSAAARDRVELTIVPFADAGRGDVRLFYTDLIGLAPELTPGPRRDLALELANLIGSADMMVDAIGPSADDPTPQYLFSVRRSVYDELAPRYPLYTRMSELIGAAPGSAAAPGGSAEPQPFRLGASMDRWLAKMAPVIKKQVFAGR